MIRWASRTRHPMMPVTGKALRAGAVFTRERPLRRARAKQGWRIVSAALSAAAALTCISASVACAAAAGFSTVSVLLLVAPGVRVSRAPRVRGRASRSVVTRAEFLRAGSRKRSNSGSKRTSQQVFAVHHSVSQRCDKPEATIDVRRTPLSVNERRELLAHSARSAIRSPRVAVDCSASCV